MQILEQLASGFTEVTPYDIYMDRGIIEGYVECVNSLLIDNVTTESIVTEGFGQRLKTLIKSIFDRLVGFLKKVTQFLTQKNKNVSGENNDQDSSGYQLTDADKKEIFAANPYTGPNISTLPTAVHNFDDGTFKNLNFLGGDIDKIFEEAKKYKNDGKDFFGKYAALYYVDKTKDSQRQLTEFPGLSYLDNNVFASQDEFDSNTMLAKKDLDEMNSIWKNIHFDVTSLKDRVSKAKSEIDTIINEDTASEKAIEVFTKAINAWASSVTYVGSSVTKAYERYNTCIGISQSYRTRVVAIMKELENTESK